MQGIRVNRDLLKVICGRDESVENYRFYIMARHAFSGKSGIFSLDDFCDLLFTEYGYASLHKKPGNKRGKYKLKFDEIFSRSVLFRRASDGRYIINSEKGILKKERGCDKSGWYQLPDKAILRSKGEFNDFCIGVFLAGNRFRANKNIADYRGCTVRRVQLATAANSRKQHFKKQYNFIDDYSGTKRKIESIRGQLFAIHGISTPHPGRYKDEWVLRLNAPNSYKTYVLSGVKGFVAQPTSAGVRKRECWFKPVRRNNLKISSSGDDHRKWVFNEAVYNFDRYIADNSIL